MKKEINELLKKSKEIAKTNPFLSLELAKEALSIAGENEKTIEVADAYYALSYAYRVMSNYVKGLSYALKALEIYDKEEDKQGLIKIKNMIGIIYFYYGDYPTALKNYTGANELLESVSDPNMSSSVLNNIGEIYRHAKEYDLALDYYKKALKVSIEHNIDGNTTILYSNIAELYYVKKSYNRAYETIKKAYEISIISNDAIALALSESMFGRLKVIDSNYTQAKEHYIKALKVLRKVDNQFYTVEILMYFSELDQLTKLNPIKRLTEALNLALELGLDAKISTIYQLMSGYYEGIGDFKMALKCWKSFHMKEKELDLQNLSKKLEILSLEFKYFKEQSHSDKLLMAGKIIEKEVIETNKEIKRIKAENAKLLEVSIIDELTQVYNRRGISRLLKEKFLKKSKSFNLIMIIDIDFFKRYNDNWGHVKGDECLQEIAKGLKNLNYKDYFVGRYGGEEFLCYAKVASLEEGIKIGDHICKMVRDLSILYDESPDSEKLTISLGGIVNDHNYSIEKCIKTADDNLYKVKQTGRNRSEISC